MFDLVRVSGLRSSMSVERRSRTLEDADIGIDDGPENVFGFLGSERLSVPPEKPGNEVNRYQADSFVRYPRTGEDPKAWVEVDGINYQVCSI